MDSFEYKKYKYPPELENHANRKELEDFLEKNWDLQKFFYDVKPDGYSKQNFLKFYNDGFETNDYIGVISFKGFQLNIYPRVFEDRKNNTKNINSSYLNTLLQINLNEWTKYFKFDNLPQARFIQTKSDFQSVDNLKELFIIIFTLWLEDILNKSGYFQYEEKTEDLSYIVGRFDVHDYICKKYPNAQLTKFKCAYSSFEFDNLLNRIIKYTCKQLIHETNKENIRIKLNNILAKLCDVNDRVCTYHDCDMVKIDKMHQEYQIILSMCKMFLLNMTTSFANHRNESFCFLFETKKLFEWFIGGFIKDNFEGVELQLKDKKLIDQIQLKENEFDDSSYFPIKPDIISTINGKAHILDTKYKEVDSLNNDNIRFIDKHQVNKSNKHHVSQNDLYQMVAYALKWNTNKTCLIYPQHLGDKVDELMPILKFNYNNNKNIDIQIARVPFVVQNQNDIFRMESQLKKIISNILKTNN